MNPVVRLERWSGDKRGIVWPSVVAILFAALSVISFAVDQGVAQGVPLSALLDLTGIDAAP